LNNRSKPNIRPNIRLRPIIRRNFSKKIIKIYFFKFSENEYSVQPNISVLSEYSAE
jgi:hypothetical protein